MKALLLLLCLSAATAGAAAEAVRIAVASNFAPVLAELVDAFSAAHPGELRVSSGSTGKLYHQITQGAPYDVFMAADVDTPQKLLASGLADPQHVYNYARGRLWLMWHGRRPAGDCLSVLRQLRPHPLAIANPRTAPYGRAALAVLDALDDAPRPRLVRGENVAQTFQFVASGNAQAGLIAAVHAKAAQRLANACALPEALHPPLTQQMVLLGAAAARPEVRAFWQFMHSAAASAIIAEHGYARD